MKISTHIFVLSLLVVTLHPVNLFALGVAKITIKVADEENKPVEGAEVELCFSGGCETKDAIRGKTDIHGAYTVSGSSSDGQVGGGVRKDGYYSSAVHHDFMVRKLGIWQPWDKNISVVLRPKINPVPMYVRNHWFKVPATDKNIGFDLIKSDWIIPYGQGVKPDLFIKVVRRYDDIDNFDASLTISFIPKWDGIQAMKADLGGDFNVGSEFRLPRLAPEKGYQQKVVKRISEGAYGFHNDESEDNNYFFRVRSEVDKDGRLKRAMYGKIRGEIRFSPRRKDDIKIRLHYYLNPDYTRNLEFDPKKNLFKNLPDSEGVALP